VELNNFDELLIGLLEVLVTDEFVFDLALDATPDLEQRLNILLALLFCLLLECLSWLGSRVSQIVAVIVEGFADSFKQNGNGSAWTEAADDFENTP
jgi:hypothetical protein